MGAQEIGGEFILRPDLESMFLGCRCSFWPFGRFFVGVRRGACRGLFYPDGGGNWGAPKRLTLWVERGRGLLG